ncbi:MAG: hypothetical protein ACRDNG_07295 [Gaiellaceae bacterium]
MIVAGVLLALGAVVSGAGMAAWAEAPDMPKRGQTFTTEDDVSRMDRRVASDRVEIFILRGTEGKAADRGGVILPPSSPDPPAAAADPAPEPKKHKRGWNRN